MDVKVISENVGDASRLKLLRSTFTKSLSVLLIESYRLAQNFGLEEEFSDCLSLTEGDDFKEKSLSRIENTLNSSKRKSEELEEILTYFGSEDLEIVEMEDEAEKKDDILHRIFNAKTRGITR